MNAFWWVVLGVVIAPVAWLLLKLFIGAATPYNVSGKLLLKKELQKYGVDPNMLGDELLVELTDSAIDMANALKDIRNEGMAEAVYKNVQGTAAAAVGYIRGEKPLFDSDPVYLALKKRGHIPTPVAGH